MMFAAWAMAVAMQDLASSAAAPAIRPTTADERKAIEGAVSAQAADPAAVRFRLPANMTVGGDYCGLVDGKDRYGEYVGYLPFHVRISHDSDGTITVSDIRISTDAATSSRIRVACVRAGLSLS